MEYKIEIRAIGYEDREVSGDYTVVGQDDNGKNIYDYAPRHVKTLEVDEKVYEQRVSDLDLGSLVSFINKPKQQYIIPTDCIEVK